MITSLALAQHSAGISPGAAIGVSLTSVAILGGMAVAMHHKRKSPRIIGWICFLIGIPLAGLLSGLLAAIAGISLWSLPVTLLLTGYVAFVFFHDGFRRGSRGGGDPRSPGGGGGNAPHRWLQPAFGLILPSLLLTLGGGVGGVASGVLNTINNGVTSTVSHVTGK